MSLRSAIGGKPVGVPLLNEISCEIFAGDRIAIVGPSGAGKTSFLRLLNRLIEPTSGSIYLDERQYPDINAIELRQQVTLVLQDTKLLGMSVKDAIAYPLTLRGMSEPEIKQRLTTWIEQLHLPSHWLERTELQLSAGERQLVALCRALAIQPKILLLDEPTSALDAGRASHVLQVLTHLATESETTAIAVTHQLDLAREFCTRVLYLHMGQLIHDLPAHQIDWEELRETLVQAEAEADREWQ